MGEYPSQNDEIVSVKEWLGSMALLLIPIVNIVLMFVWAFSTDVKKSKSNFFKAQLILTGIILGIYLIFLVLIMVFAITMSNFY
ncbi:MAG: hypothetical protein CVU84_13610 [Firmicutes bacterium HGW-Firmicutes-1]|nr:MAG: hypothetical protein CVU84_13610 [Firmicutes bacterium HGW-Firmicutes-1]